jgi:hypothetical protein
MSELKSWIGNRILKTVKIWLWACSYYGMAGCPEILG